MKTLMFLLLTQLSILAAAAHAADIEPNVITWSTASEHDSFGYDVYRGLSEDGPFTVVNDEVIPGAGTTDLPRRYEYVDDAIEPDTTYWYYIESISLTGERRRITPIHPSRSGPEHDDWRRSPGQPGAESGAGHTRG